MTVIEQAFIFAAGRGERMRPITDSIPKPLVKIAGTTMLDRAIEKVSHVTEIKKIIINSYYLSDIIENHIKSLNNPKIVLSKENSKLETGGGLLNALKLIDKNKPILLINSDIVWQEDKGKPSILKLMIDNFNEKEMDIMLGLKSKNEFIGYEGSGDFLFDSKNGNISNPEDDSILEYVFAGIQIIHPRILDRCPEPPFSINYFYKNARQKNGLLKRIKGMELPGKFFHIGTTKMVEKVNSKFNNLFI